MLQKKPRSPIIGTAIILITLGLQIAIIWKYVPLTWFAQWTEVPIRAGCLVELTAADAPTTVFKGRSFAVRVTVHNPSSEKSCDVDGYLVAGAFESSTEPRLRLALAPKQSGTLEWELRPKERGPAGFWVTINNATRDFPVIVKTDEIEPQDIALWFSPLGWFLGSWWNLPWWIEKLKKWRKRRWDRK